MLRRIAIKIKKISRILSINKKNSCDISLSAHIDDLSVFEGRNCVYPKSSITQSVVGYATYISNSCSFYKTRIGRYCSIGSNVRIISGNHPTSKYVSTHPLFYTNKTFSGLSISNTNAFNEYTYTNDSERLLCEIGNDVWIGEDVKIINGATIGDGAIIATGAVVCKHVPPYAIVGGVPAKIIRYRFDEEEINYLLNLKWWNKDEDWIRGNANLFCDVKKLKKIKEKDDHIEKRDS